MMQNKVLSSSTEECSITGFFLGLPRLRGAGLGVGTGVSSGLDITLWEFAAAVSPFFPAGVTETSYIIRKLTKNQR